MRHYFASDIHLRLDEPERSTRFAEFVERLSPGEALIIVGDLCDFWYAARQRSHQDNLCPALRALRTFAGAGGELLITVGNHDRWLGPFYARVLGASVVSEPLDVRSGGLRIQAAHGHRTVARFHWKRLLETWLFWRSFELLPAAGARWLDRALMSEKGFRRQEKNERFTARLRRYVASHAEEADLFVFGHVHTRTDEPIGSSRLVILGSWIKSPQYLCVQEGELTVVGEPIP